MKIKHCVIDDIVDNLQTGKTPPTNREDYFNGDINWYTPGDLNNGKLLNKSTRSISKVAVDEKKAIIFEPNTVLISCIGDIGKLGITQEPCSSNQQICGIKPKNLLISEYLYYWFMYSKKYISDIANNAVVPIINSTRLKGLKFYYPTQKSDQEYICKTLDKADSIRKKRKETIKLADEFLRSTFLEMFGDPFNIKHKKVNLTDYVELNPKKSEITNIDSLAEVTFLPMASVSDNGYILKRDKRKIEEVKKGFTYFAEGDVLFAKITPCMENGKGCIADNLINGIGFGSTEFHVLRPINGGTKSWLLHLLKNKNLRVHAEKNMTGSAGQKRVPISFFDKLMIPEPNVEKMLKFDQIYYKTLSLLQKYQKSLEESENLFNSLMQRAFRGEL